MLPPPLEKGRGGRFRLDARLPADVHEELARAASAGPGFEALRLGALSDAGLGFWCAALRTAQVRVLALRGDLDPRALVLVLRTSTALRVLDLHGVRLGPEAAEPRAQVLAHGAVAREGAAWLG